MKRVLTQALAVLILIATLGAAPVENSSGSNEVPRSRAIQKQAVVIGKASWYGKYFDGRHCANGEPYDMFRFTAAHRELPLGTLVKVTNLRNGKWVVVKVNDRGPVPRNRIIDLSYGAAEILGMRARGLATVRLDILPQRNEALIARNFGSSEE